MTISFWTTIVLRPPNSAAVAASHTRDLHGLLERQEVSYKSSFEMVFAQRHQPNSLAIIPVSVVFPPPIRP